MEYGELSPKEWKDFYWDFADEDLRVAELLVSENPRLCVYHLGQSMEKYLKAIMAKRLNLNDKIINQTFVRDHNLEKLIQRTCKIYGAEMSITPDYLHEQIRSCIPTLHRVKLYTFNKVRYPRWDSKRKRPASWQFSTKDCLKMIAEIKSLRNWLAALP